MTPLCFGLEHPPRTRVWTRLVVSHPWSTSLFAGEWPLLPRTHAIRFLIIRAHFLPEGVIPPGGFSHRRRPPLGKGAYSYSILSGFFSPPEGDFGNKGAPFFFKLLPLNCLHARKIYIKKHVEITSPSIKSPSWGVNLPPLLDTSLHAILSAIVFFGSPFYRNGTPVRPCVRLSVPVLQPKPRYIFFLIFCMKLYFQKT